MRKIKDFLARPKTRYIAIPLAALILFGLAFAFQPVKVETGSRVVCKYGEIITDRTKSITVPRLFARAYGVKTSKSTCPKHRTVERLYDDANRLIAQGDLRTAGKLLGSIKKRDPKFKDIDKKIASLNKELIAAGLPTIPIDGGTGDSSGSDSGGGEGTGDSGSSGTSSSGNNDSGGNDDGGGSDTPGDDGTPTYLYLLDLLPDEMSGYELWAEDFATLSASRTFSPKGSTKIKLLTLAVDLAGNADSADAYIEGKIKSSYPGSKDDNVKVEGRECYFGTHANQFAMLAWQEGGIVYQVEMMAKNNPEDLKDDIVKLAKKID